MLSVAKRGGALRCALLVFFCALWLYLRALPLCWRALRNVLYALQEFLSALAFRGGRLRVFFDEIGYFLNGLRHVQPSFQREQP